MPAREMTSIRTRSELRAAATGRGRVRLRGVVTDTGGGHYAGGYRNVWLRIKTVAGDVRITASPGSQLGARAEQDPVDLAVTLTGLVDLADGGVYYGERAQLLG